MELHQLRYFLAVVDEGSFTAAAEAVRISQSGISTQIQKLERELGISLIDRSARRVALTSAGSSLVPHARTAVAAVEGVAGAAREIRGLVVGSLRVATVTGLVWPRLFDGLAAVHAQHPGIDIRLHEGTSDDHVAAVRDGTRRRRRGRLGRRRAVRGRGVGGRRRPAGGRGRSPPSLGDPRSGPSW